MRRRVRRSWRRMPAPAARSAPPRTKGPVVEDPVLASPLWSGCDTGTTAWDVVVVLLLLVVVVVADVVVLVAALVVVDVGTVVVVDLVVVVLVVG